MIVFEQVFASSFSSHLICRSKGKCLAALQENLHLLKFESKAEVKETEVGLAFLSPGS